MAVHRRHRKAVELTKRQRNEVFEVLEQEGVDPAACEFRVDPWVPGQGVVRRALLRHMLSGSNLKIEERDDPDKIRYWATYSVADGPDGESSCADWDRVLAYIAHWAQEVAYVTKTPDFWAELRQVPEIMAAAQSADASNALFTPDERAEISNRLDEIKQLVRDQFELTDEQLAAVDQRLDDAEQASKRLGRKDWLMAFYGGVISTTITDAVPPGVIQTVLTTVVHGIAHIFGFGGPPPIISA